MPDINMPQPGFYKIRLVRNGPWVAARIYRPCPMMPAIHDVHHSEWCCPLDRSQWLKAEINGRRANVFRVWTGGQPVTPAEFEYLNSAAAWDRKYAPAAPAANPTKAVDVNTMAPIF